MLTKLAAFAAAAFAFVPITHAQDIASKADQYISGLVKENEFSGAVLVARNGKPIFRKAYGLANREWNIPATPETKFRLASITKQFTATAILQLVDAGKLKLDDPISKYYAESPAAWSNVTIHHLLNHTSGIPSYTGLPGFFDKSSKNDLKPAEIVKLTQDLPLDFQPGAQWKYDNTGYVLLGYVIEKVSGQSYADYVREHIFQPLGMNDSGYDLSTDVIPRRASGYVYEKEHWQNAPYLSMTLPYAAGSLYSTVDDLLRWDQALYAKKLLSAESFKKMFTAYQHDYGYGWVIDKKLGHRHISHNGGINGFSTEINRYPDDDVTVIVLANMATKASSRIATELAGMVFGAASVSKAQSGEGK